MNAVSRTLPNERSQPPFDLIQTPTKSGGRRDWRNSAQSFCESHSEGLSFLQ